ncbi:MAG TPA: NADH-quinone oxidoreductase subunit N [Coriobacteriia bacterium]|nr:NADH-quinone oxidoreductase subunit N [Coriobacteriia bacterium]
MTEPVAAVGLLAPQLIVALTGVVVLLADLIWMKKASEPGSRPWIAYLGIGGLIIAVVASIMGAGSHGTAFSGAITVDSLTTFFDLVFLGIGIVVLLLSIDALPSFTSWPAEFYAMVIWCTLGSMLIAPVTELFTLFVCLQLTSLPLIVLIAFGKRDVRSREAAMKYLLLVLVSTALFLYGLSLVYGSLGTSSMAKIGSILAERPLPAIGAIGLVLMLAGFGFKTTSAPFQSWVPDVYEGSPTPVTALLSVGSKLTGFALVLRFVVTGLGAQPKLHLVFAVLAVASMLVGNLGALQQNNIKRLLAYSGIAQAGYILVGLAAMSATGMSALLFYLAAYGIANLLAFAVVIAFTRAVGSENIADYAGLARRSPLAALGLTAALMSLAGLPLTAGFMAKFYVFLSAAQAGLYWLVLIAVANAVLAFYYYLRVVWALWVQESDAELLTVSPRLSLVMAGCTLGVVAVGLFPAPLLDATTRAAGALFGL